MAFVRSSKTSLEQIALACWEVRQLKKKVNYLSTENRRITKLKYLGFSSLI